MEKEQFTRQHLKKNIMHSIIFRIDYQGLVDIESFINTFVSRYQKRFKFYQTAFSNQIDLYITNFEEISESLSIPIKEIERQTIHRFTEADLGPDEVILDITKYFTVLQINCKDYQGIDPYLDFFSEFCNLICESNQYLAIKRFGLRKIGTDRFSTIESIFEDFEARYFDFQFIGLGFSSSRREIKDLLNTEELIQIDYKRGFEKGYLQHPNGNLEEKYQVTLDIDGIIGEQEIISLDFKNRTREILKLINDKYLFQFFKMSVTKKFLERNSKHD